MADRAIMSTQPAISVCIANYNGMTVIDDCLRSVLAQEFDLQVEIIVHDDASTDDSVHHIEINYPNIKLIASNKNVGFCASNNRMVSIANGAFLLLLNNDAELQPGALKSLHEYAKKNTFNGILTLAQYDKSTSDLLDIGSRFDLFMNPVPNLNPSIKLVGMGMGACLWLPMKLWGEIGGFPEWFGSLAEDMFLCLAAWNLGYEVHALSETGYNHWVGNSFGGGKIQKNKLITTFRRRALSERNKTYIICIFYPWPLLFIVFPLHLILLTIEGASLALLKRNSAYLKDIYIPAILGSLKVRKKLYDERKKWQQIRNASLFSFFRLIVFFPYKLRMLIKHGLPDVS